jgi:hypothetical protein
MNVSILLQFVTPLAKLVSVQLPTIAHLAMRNYMFWWILLVWIQTIVLFPSITIMMKPPMFLDQTNAATIVNAQAQDCAHHMDIAMNVNMWLITSQICMTLLTVLLAMQVASLVTV